MADTNENTVAVKSNTNITEEVIVNKKKPGRPKKNLVNTPIDIRGICDEPQDPANKVEMAYSNPKMFKKIFALFRAYECDQIAIKFERLGIRMQSLDHTQKTSIIVWIDGRNLNWYYCKEPIIQYHSKNNLENIFGTIDKSNHKIIFMLDEISYKSKMKIILTENQFSDTSTYTVEAGTTDVNIRIGEDFQRDNAYKLKLKFDSKHFKKKINDISKFSQIIHMNKLGAKDKFRMQACGNREINYVGTYEDDAKISTHCTLGENEEIKFGVYVEHIKPFSNTCIGNEVFLAANNSNVSGKIISELSLTTRLDQRENNFSCYIKIFTETS